MEKSGGLPASAVVILCRFISFRKVVFLLVLEKGIGLRKIHRLTIDRYEPRVSRSEFDFFMILA